MKRKKLTSDEEQHLIGHIIRYERTKDNIKLCELASSINKSKQYLSEIENGSKKISYSTIIEIFNKLNIEFKFEYSEAVDEYFFEFSELFYFHDLANAKNKLRQISYNKNFKYSWNYPSVILSQYILDAMEYQNDINPEELENLYSLLSKSQQTLYYFFRATLEYSVKNDKESIKFYECANETVGSIPSYQAIINTGLALVYDRNNCLLKAIDYNQQAYLQFTSHNNTERAIACELHIGNEYSKLFFLDMAIEQYKITLRDAKRFNVLRIIDLVYRNLAVSYLYNDDYTDAIMIALDGIKVVKNPAVLYYVLSWSYYELHKKQLSIRYLEKLKELDNRTPYLEKIILIQTIKMNYGKCAKEYIEVLLDFYNYNLENEMAAEQIFSLNLIVEFFDLKKDYKNAYLYSSILLKYYRN